MGAEHYGEERAETAEALTNVLETCILPSWRGNDCPLSTTPVAAPEPAGDAETPSAPVL